MCRPAERIITIAIAASLAHFAAAAAPEANERVEAWLADNALDAPLAIVLEQQLSGADEASRRAIAQRLASLYARMLERGEQQAAFEDIERRAADILRELGDREALDLRLAVARASYLRAEAIAEKARVGLVPQAETETARRAFADLAPRLEVIAMAATDRVRALEEQEEQITDSQGLIRAALTEARRVRLQASFLAGWAAVYLAELDQGVRTESAERATVRFGVLLNAEPRRPADPARVRTGMLEDEPVGRSVIGCAMASELLGQRAAADRWIDLLITAPQLPEAIRAAVPSWRMVILANRSDWSGVQGVIDGVEQQRRSRGGEPLTVAEARLITTLALPSDEPGARRLVERGVVALVALGEVGQLVDLAGRLMPVFEARQDPFLTGLLRGLRDLNLADQRAGVETESTAPPALDETAITLYRNAERSLEAAVAAAPSDAPALTRGIALLARAIAAERPARTVPALLRAAELYEEASRSLEPVDRDRAADAQRLAIGAVERAGDLAPTDPRVIAARDRAVGAFLQRFADHPSAGPFAIRAAVAPGVPRRRSIASLEQIPPASPVYRDARRELARLLYLDYRSAPPGQRAAAARAFLAVADDVLTLDAQDDARGTLDAPERAAANARMILDCALNADASSAAIAQRAFDLLSSLVSRRAVSGEGFEGEYRFRVVQIALLRGEPERAEEAAEALREADPAAFTQAQRLLFDDAAARWRRAVASGEPSDRLSPLAQRVVRLGRDVLRRMDQQGGAPADAARLAAQATTADAAASLWFTSNDADARDLAVLLYRAALRAAPDSRPLLHAAWRVLLDAGDRDGALDCLARLQSGLEAGSPDWFEARGEYIILLSQADPARARTLLRQHASLYPQFAPGRMGERLAALRDRLEGAAP